MNYIKLSNENVTFLAGKTYRLGTDGAVITAVNTVTILATTQYWLSAKVTSGDLILVSGSLPAAGQSPDVYLSTSSTGLTLQVEQVAATAALRDRVIASQTKENSYQIDQLWSSVNAAAVIDDQTLDSTSTTLSSSKISQLVSDAQAAAQNYASTAASGIIDDAATGTDKVLSASKVTALLAAAKTDLENFATSAASGIIDDAATGTDKVLSASKVTTLLNALDTAAANYAAAVRSDLLGGADSAYDTLREIQTFLQNNADLISALESAGMNKVSFTELQDLSPAQQQRARTNIGAITGDEATIIANDRIAAVVGDPSTLSVSAIFASLAFTLS